MAMLACTDVYFYVLGTSHRSNAIDCGDSGGVRARRSVHGPEDCGRTPELILLLVSLTRQLQAIPDTWPQGRKVIGDGNCFWRGMSYFSILGPARC